jgi:hypothetical protein
MGPWRSHGGWAQRIAPPQQGWLVLGVEHGHSPIVDDESCDFLCRGTRELAECIEIDGMVIEDGQWTGR